MNDATLSRLERLSAGDGEMRVSAKLMRSLVAQARSGISSDPAHRSNAHPLGLERR